MTPTRCPSCSGEADAARLDLEGSSPMAIASNADLLGRALPDYPSLRSLCLVSALAVALSGPPRD